MKIITEDLTDIQKQLSTSSGLLLSLYQKHIKKSVNIYISVCKRNTVRGGYLDFVSGFTQ